MKRIIWFIFMILIAVPAFAQDDEGGGGSDSGDFGDEGPATSIQSIPKVDPLADLRNWLARASAPPIEKSQEKPLKSLYDRQVKEMAKSFKTQFGVSLDSAIAAQSPARGRRGGAARPVDPAQSAEIARLSNQLSDRVIAALRMDQQAALRKYQSDQLRVKEVSLIKQKMKAAGITLTHEQESQIEAVYARKSRLRTLVIIDARGESYDKNITILNKQTTQRVVQVLSPTQIAVLSSANKAKTP